MWKFSSFQKTPNEGNLNLKTYNSILGVAKVFSDFGQWAIICTRYTGPINQKQSSRGVL